MQQGEPDDGGSHGGHRMLAWAYDARAPVQQADGGGRVWQHPVLFCQRQRVGQQRMGASGSGAEMRTGEGSDAAPIRNAAKSLSPGLRSTSRPARSDAASTSALAGGNAACKIARCASWAA
ncbi:MAG: hypothetical protein HND48_03135 [Chloroflexi bacterium]|nr:hypothetical protein [Chloroflexota bacterium]